MKKHIRVISFILAMITVVTTALSCAPADDISNDTNATVNEEQTADTEQKATDAMSEEVTTDVATEEVTTEKKPAEKISISVNSVPLENFVIVYRADDNAGLSNSKNLKNELKKRTGLELGANSDSKAETEYEIIIGRADRSMETDFYYTEYKYVNKFEIYVSGKKVFFHALNEEAQSASVDGFIAYIDALMSDGIDVIDLTDETQIVGDVYSSKSIGINRRVNETDIRIAGNNILFHQKSEPELYSVRKNDMLASFVLFDADVLMLQECGYDKNHSPSRTTWHDELDPILETLGYTQVECELPVRATENYTPIWYNPTKLELVEGKYNLFNSVKYSPDSYLSNSKSYTRAIFKDRNTGKTFACISTHFTWAADNFKPTPAELRLSDAKEVAAEVKALKATHGEDFPIFVTGDFNCGTSDAPYRELAAMMKNAKMAVKVRNNVSSSTSHALGVYPGEGGTIDHTLVSGSGYQAVQYQHVVNRWTVNATDHVPLLLDIDFTAK